MLVCCVDPIRVHDPQFDKPSPSWYKMLSFKSRVWKEVELVKLFYFAAVSICSDIVGWNWQDGTAVAEQSGVVNMNDFETDIMS